ncbi:multiheme c-type cytochrome [uncultured Gimesia sp.]|uniref:multiheme c-type cytochrome n=1 Tax=uncultured Gimesia sp. TaxID=1678688 RepID=UPI0030D703BC|tara:strand:- start:66188 stop:67357 length:1170 start_codon:yes stop_codon:yes gene_type:complete
MSQKYPFIPALLILLLAFASGTAWYLYGSQGNISFVPKVRSSEQPVKMKQCCECHEKVCHQFSGAPHLRTLRKATDSDVLEKFAGKEITLKENGLTYRFYAEDDALWVKCDSYPSPVRIEWVFGSGLHAMTPVSLFPNEAGESVLLQHIVSWYPPGKLGVTLGLQNLAHNKTGIQTLGEVSSHAKTMNCFGCHTSYLGDVPGEIDQSQMITGISCARCHLNGEEHIKAVERGDKDLHILNWNQLTPLKSINRCGECHRRSDQLESDEIHPDNDLLIRFAPVGMSQSPCFLKQSEVKLADGKPARFDCTTCHNPHQQASRDPEVYRKVCLNCHSDLKDHAPVCSKESMQSQCLQCHMPPVEVHDNLSFTDHWIRIREHDKERFPEFQLNK